MRKNLKRFVLLCFCAAFLANSSFASLFAGASPAGKTLKVLAIGNSFSVDGMQYLYQLAQDCGATDIVLGNLYIGGCSLETHWSNAQNNTAAYVYYKNTSGSWTEKDNQTMLAGIQDENWDIITLQQVSGLSGVESTYNSDLTNLISYVNSHKTNASAKLMWHMTWAYQTGSTHPDFPRYNSNQMTMYQDITQAVSDVIVPNSAFSGVIPSGTAIQNVRTSFLGDNLNRDGYHLNDLGRYIAGMTWLKALTGWSIDNISWVPSATTVPAAYLPMIKQAVNNAVATPFAVTNSTYTQDYSHYKLLDWQPTGKSFWNSMDNTLYAVLFTTQNSTAGNLQYFVSSAKMFTKADIPNGSIIVVDAGYQYRPEGWTTLTKQSTRPNPVTTPYVVVDDNWWGNYNYRAFNVSVVGSNVDLSNAVTQTASHFRIYIPMSAEKAISGLSVSGVNGTISGNEITVNLPAGTDETALSPTIQVSDKATVSPASGSVQDFTSPVSYTVTAEDGSTQVYTVTVHVAALPSSQKAITGFSVSGVNGTISGSAITVNLPAGTDVTALAPVIQVSDKATVSPASGTTHDFTSPVSYTVTAEDGSTQVYTVTVHVAALPSSQKAITGFSVGGVKGTISGNAITVNLPAGTDVTALSPTIQVSDKATVSPASGTTHDFTGPVSYTVTAEDGSTQVYTVTVHVAAAPGNESSMPGSSNASPSGNSPAGSSNTSVSSASQTSGSPNTGDASAIPGILGLALVSSAAGVFVLKKTRR